MLTQQTLAKVRRQLRTYGMPEVHKFGSAEPDNAPAREERERREKGKTEKAQGT